MVGTGEPVVGRIYRITDNGLERLYSRAFQQDPCQILSACLTNFYWLSRPAVSSEGGGVNFTSQRYCTGSSQCIRTPTVQSSVAYPRMSAIDGSVRISRSGRYGVSTLVGGIQQSASLFADFSTGAVTPLPWFDIRAVGRVISDAGVFVQSGSLTIWRNGVSRQLNGRSASDAVIDAAGRHIVYATYGQDTLNRSLRAYDLDFDTDRAFISGNGDVYSPSISADGRRITFVSTAQFGTASQPQPPQLFAVNLDGTGYRQITFEMSGVIQTVTSDDGQVAWYVSGEGKLVKAYLDTGQLVEYLAAPTSLLRAEPLVPGSVATLYGVGLSGRVTIGGREARVLENSTTTTTVLVPWETPAGESFSNAPSVAVRMFPSISPSSPFEANLELSVTSYVRDPTILTDSSNGPAKAVHGDWSGLVTAERPAWPGEIVHLYAKRLGPVDSEGRVVPTLRCTVASTNGSGLIDVPVLYAGIAPGFDGYYQISIRIPSASLLPTSYFRFRPESGGFEFGARLPVSRWPIP